MMKYTIIIIVTGSALLLYGLWPSNQLPVLQPTQISLKEAKTTPPMDINHIESVPVKIVETVKAESKTTIVQPTPKVIGGKSPATLAYEQKLRNLPTIGRGLSTKEIETIYTALRQPGNDEKDLHIKDELLRKLEGQAPASGDWIGRFIEMAEDKTLDGNLRGYVVQHLRSAYDKADEEKRNHIRDCLYDSLADSTTDVSGTALLALTCLKDQSYGFDEIKIRTAALELARSSSTHGPSRISAMQLAGKMKLKEILPTARKLANDKNDIVLQVAAISALGQLGDESDLPLLNTFLNNRKAKALHPAVKKSMHKIKSRLKIQES